MEIELGRAVLAVVIVLTIVATYTAFVIGATLLYTLPSRKGPDESE